MIKYYFKSAYRNLLKNKVNSIINILGLSIGVSACILILLYINYEKSYDKFHEGSERIYRLRYERTSSGGKTVRFASCAPPAAALIKEKFPEVEKIARIFKYKAVISFKDKKFFEDKIFFAEPDFLSILKFKMLVGDPLNGITEPNNAFISQSTAKKYYGNENPVGKVFSLDKKKDYMVKGIFQDLPDNSHIKFDFLLSYKNFFELYGNDYQQSWGQTGAYTYLKLQKGANSQDLEKKTIPLIKAAVPWLKQYKMSMNLKMQPLEDIHLNSHFMQEYENNGDLGAVKFLFIIAILIIVIAWTNYINLATAQSIKRAKEVGIRKSVGASRFDLIIQFFTETVVLNTISIVCALVFLLITFPFFSEITGVSKNYFLWSEIWFWLVLISLYAGGIFLSGTYPVLAMSAYLPAKVLKGKSLRTGKGKALRRGLVVFQFFSALILIGGTITVFKQISYMRSQNLGVSIDQIMVVKSPRVRSDNPAEKFRMFKEMVKNNNLIINAGHVTEVPGKQLYWDAGGIRKAGTDSSLGKNYKIIGIDYNFTDIFGLKILTGRNFKKEFKEDETESILMNENGIKWMGFGSIEEAVNKKVDYWGKLYKIAGIIKNYHQESLKEDYEPIVYRLMPTGRDVRGYFVFKLKMNYIQDGVNEISREFKKIFPGNPFEFFFLDDFYNQQYQSDQLFGRIVNIFSFLAIFITALGVFGLASHNATQRVKEVGIRKVLGSSISQIVFLFLKDLFKVLIAATVIAVPVIFWGAQKWLSGFAFRMNLSLWIFLLPVFVVVMTNVFTVTYLTIKSAAINPVEVLRDE